MGNIKQLLYIKSIFILILSFLPETTCLSQTIKYHKPSPQKKLLKCDQCKYSCKYRSHLRQHYRKHSGKKPFQCYYCKKCFSQTSNRNTHILLKHGINVRTIRFKCAHRNTLPNSERERKIHKKEHIAVDALLLLGRAIGFSGLKENDSPPN